MTKKIPQYGDPEILPRGTVTLPSRERNPFDSSGTLKPEGAGPYPEGFLLTPDLVPFGDPHNPHSRYVRRRGDEWSDEAMRALFLRWMTLFVRARPWAIGWQIVERWAPQRSMELGTRHLVVRITRRAIPLPCTKRNTRLYVQSILEMSAMFPRGANTDAAEVARILASIESSLDAEHTRLL